MTNQFEKTNLSLLKRLGALATIAAFLLGASGAKALTLGWDRSSDASVKGYAVYYGSGSGAYNQRVDVGNNITATIASRGAGSTTYFIVKSYNAAGMEGMPSVELSYVAPLGANTVALVPQAGGPPAIRFMTTVGHSTEVQASADLKTWTKLFQTSTATSATLVSYGDPQGTTMQKRFYRLVVH